MWGGWGLYSNGSLFHTGIDCRVLMQKQGMHFYAAGGSPLLMASDYIIYSPCCWLGNAFIPWGIKKRGQKSGASSSRPTISAGICYRLPHRVAYHGIRQRCPGRIEKGGNIKHRSACNLSHNVCIGRHIGALQHNGSNLGVGGDQFPGSGLHLFSAL